MIEGRFVARSDDPIIYRVLFDDGTGFSKSARSHGNSDTQGPGHPLALECLLGEAAAGGGVGGAGSERVGAGS